MREKGPAQHGEGSLHGHLLLRLALVMGVLLALDAVASYLTAVHFASVVYDRWLIDSARSLAQEARASGSRVELDVPRVALEIFQYDEMDQISFKVSSPTQGCIAGEPELPDAPVPAGGTGLIYGRLHGQPVRVASAAVITGSPADPVTVSVSETLNKRSTLAHEVLLGMVPAQVALLAFAGLLAWLVVSRGLKPLTDFAAAIEARGQDNLAPLALTGLPRETRVLAGRLNDLLSRLSRSLSAQRRFVADAAHQLRTPLAAVLLRAEAAERAPDGPAARQALAELHRSVERTARLSQQLLALARTDPEAAAGLTMKEIDLVALARRVGEEWIPQALARDVDFGLVVPDRPVPVAGDERLLGELLSNLIDNALRYGVQARRDGEPGHVTVHVEAAPSPGLAVQDDGPGIPEEERTRIFERFYRLPSSPGEGCGLGLAIVEEIAAAHHCAMEVATGPDGRGARFTVRFRGTAAHGA
jgi:two-component system, OmpR family, sensor histidine kinase TctE